MYRLYNLAKYKAVFAIAFAMLMGLLLSPSFVWADPNGEACTSNGDCDSNNCVNKICAPINVNAADPNVDVFGVGKIKSETALGTSELVPTATKIINVALGLLGIVAVVIILIGGFKWMTAGGNDEQVGEARKWIFSGIIGLAIILSAWAIATFVLKNLGKATGVTGKFGDQAF